MTDDAWALDYAFRGDADLPKGALEQGSDLAIGSVHKTLSGLGQPSVLSVGSDRIDTERLQLCFELQESTSASALLLAAIDAARAQFVCEGGSLLQRAVDSARLLRERLAAEVPELRVIASEELAGCPGCGRRGLHACEDRDRVGRSDRLPGRRLAARRAYLKEIVRNGGFVEGAADSSLGSFRVIACLGRPL